MESVFKKRPKLVIIMTKSKLAGMFILIYTDNQTLNYIPKSGLIGSISHFNPSKNRNKTRKFACIFETLRDIRPTELKTTLFILELWQIAKKSCFRNFRP